MVKTIFIFGERGKTILIYGLLRKFSYEGLKVGYFKPIAKARYRLPSMKYVDPDVISIKDALGLSDSVEHIGPIVITRNILDLGEDLDEVKKRIIDSFNKIREGKDVVIAEGYPTPEAMLSIGLALPELIKILNAKPIFVANVRDKDVVDEVVDKVLLYKCFFEHLGASLDGVILNNVPIYYFERVEDRVAPMLKNLGLKVYGIVSEKPKLLAPTVRDIIEVLNAEVLEGRDKLNNIVEDIVVGAMSTAGALRWLRRAVNAAVITGGDRTDYIIASLESRPSVVILTGNYYPDIGVLIKAKEVGVPLLLVPYDTYTTIEKLREVQTIVTADSLRSKEGEILNTISKEVEWKKILED